ncbi:MAG TPA: long-chain fatty acid--CoA ligase [Gemmatimonadales bacterium]
MPHEAAEPVTAGTTDRSAFSPAVGAQQEARGGPRPAPGTLNRLFFDAIEKYGRPDALQYKVQGEFRPISHRTVGERVRRIALGLRELGMQPGDRIALLSENRPEWALVDFGCLTGGFTDVPIYPTLPAEQIPFQLVNSGSRVVFVSTAEQAAKIAQVRAKAPNVEHVIAFDEGATADMTLAELEARGAAAESPDRIARYREEALAVRPDDLATIIYTSGTTGDPKGVMLTHDNFHSNVAAACEAVPFAGDDTCLSFLPLSHVLERMAGHYLMWRTGTSIAYAESIDTVPIDMQIVRPSLVISVPRLYEKIYARVLENALAGGAVKKRIFFWARGVADKWADEVLAGRTPGGALAFKYRLAQKLVFSKLRERTGGRLRYFVSGGAPLAPEINKFFYAAGLVILEGYGLTETSPVIAVNTPEAFRIGTVGRPIDGVEVRIAADGEILTRGPNVMSGYYQRPDATAETIDADGWLHTGDIGVLEDGFLRITDRKKDIIVTAGGKNIAPQPIENQVKTNKYVSQAVMIGDKRKYPVMLVVPNFEQLEKWAKIRNLLWTDRAQLLTMPTVQAKMNKEVFGQLEGLASYETPKKIALLEHDFSIERGELTPTLKVKRRVVDRQYAELIDGLYQG